MPTFEFTSPEGKTYEIEGPAGATPEQAFQILQRHLSGQVETQQQDSVGRQAGLAARYAVEGATALPAMVGNAANTAINYGIRGINSLTGKNIPQLGMVSDAISGGLTDIGLPQPQTGTERVVGDMSRALSGAGGQIGLVSKLASNAAPAAQSILSQLASQPSVQAQAAAGAGFGGGVVREMGGGPVAQMAGALAGGIAFPTAAGMARPSAPKPSKIDTRAAKMISKTAKDSGMSPDDIMRELDNIGPDATLSDVNDTFMRNARAIYTTKGPAAEITKSALEGRAAEMSKRTIGDLKSITGKDTNFFETVQGTIAKRKAQSAPLYAEADKASVQESSIKGLHSQILEKAKDAEGTRLAGALRRFAGALKSGDEFKTGIRQLDVVKRQTRDMVSRAYRSGDSDTGKELDSMLKVLSDSKGGGILERSSVAYREANKVFSDETSVLKALEAGKKVLSEDADEIAANIKSLSLAEKDGYMQGAVKAIRDKILSGGRFNNELVRERMRNVFDSEKHFNRFMKVLDREKQYSRTKNDVLGGSQTMNKGSDLADAAMETGRKFMLEGSRSAAIGAIKRILGSSNTIPQELREPLARMLVTPDGSRKAVQMLITKGVPESSIRKALNDLKTTNPNTVGGGLGIVQGIASQR